MKKCFLLFAPLLFLNFDCKNSAPAEEAIPVKAVLVGNKKMELARRKATGELTWNQDAQALAEAWKKESPSKRDSVRMLLAPVFDEDSSILIGLSEKDIIQLLGKPEDEKENSYKYDFHYNEKNEYMGCWMQLVYDENRKVKDIVRICP